MSKSFAQRTNDARLLVAGIRAHLEELNDVGITAEKATEVESFTAKAIELDTKQEKLKADLKICTTELGEELKLLDVQIADLRKRIKLAIPQAGWQEFGISDKR